MSQTSTHLATFHQYIRAGVQASLARVHAAEYVVPEADRQQAWHMLSFALDVPEVWNVTRALLLALAPKMEQAGFRQGWVAYLSEAYRISQERQDRQMAAECALQIGTLCRMMSHFADAQNWLRTSIEYFTAQVDNFGERRALNELAWLEQLQHHYDEATGLVERALTLANADDVERGMSLRVLGMIANSQRQWQKAQVFHEQALAIFAHIGDQRRTGWSLQNLALALLEQAEIERAIASYAQAAQILEASRDDYHLAVIYMNLGVAYHRLGNSVASLLHYTAAATTFYQLLDTLNIAKIETNLGLSHHALHNYRAAEQSFLTAAASYAKLGDLAWQLNAMAGLGMTYVAAQQYEQAFAVLERALSEIDQIKEHPYYESILNFLLQYLAEARSGMTNNIPDLTSSTLSSE